MKSFAAAVFVVLLVTMFSCTVEAGSCHGTPSKAAPPVAAEPTHVGVSVDVETPSPAGVETSVVVNGEDVTPAGVSAPSEAAGGGSGVGLHAAVKNARREKRATIRLAYDNRRSARHAAKASEAAAEAAVEARVRQAYE